MLISQASVGWTDKKVSEALTKKNLCTYCAYTQTKRRDSMSKLKAYSVRDSKTELFHLPFFTQTHGDAERSFSATVNNPQTTINQFPEDFDLWHIGEYDQTTGIMVPLKTPTHIAKAISALRKKEAVENTQMQ